METKSKDTVTIALCQMKVVYNDPKGNLERAAAWIRKAREQGADIAVFPECMDLGWADENVPLMAEEIPGERTAFLEKICEETGMYIVAGLTEREGEKLYNTAVLISDKGEILLKHRKIGLLRDVEGIYSVGDRLGVAHTPFGTIGVDICADNTMQSIHLAHSLARMGADMILSPCAWAVPREDMEKPYGATWLVPYSLVCRTYGIMMAGVSCVGSVGSGKWKGWYNIGNSIAMGKDGEPLKILPFGEDQECMQLLEVEKK